MPKFKIQGQVYPKGGSLLPMQNEETKFLQIYFLGDEEAEAQRRFSIIPAVSKQLIESLQQMLHKHNYYIQTFQTALDGNVDDDKKIVIKADRKYAEGDDRVFNAPTVNEVAIIIAGNDFEKRGIVLKKCSNELKTICETHISYDAWQYPLMFPRGEDGYAININQVVPGTTNPVSKTVSSMSYYSYRLMERQNYKNHLLNYRQLLHQYLVDMYAKIETERLLFIRLNQQKLRVYDYIHLKDAVANIGNASNHGKLVILPSTYTGGPRNKYMHTYMSHATNSEFSDFSWLQAGLPVRFGGLGIQCTCDLAAPAYLASLQASESLSAVILSRTAVTNNGLSDSCLVSWRNVVGSSITFPASTTGQRGWTEPVYRVLLDSLIASLSGADRARLLAVSSPHSSVWIYALPSHSLGLCLRNDLTRIVIDLHAGVILVLLHSCVCGVSVASNGHLGLSCCRRIGRHSRHSAINWIIAVAAPGCLIRWGKHFSVGRQTSHVVQIGSYFKLVVTFS